MGGKGKGPSYGYDWSDLDQDRAPRRKRLLTALFSLLFAIFAAGGLFFGLVFVSTMADIFSGNLIQSSDNSTLPILAPIFGNQSAITTASPQGTPRNKPGSTPPVSASTLAPGAPTATPDPLSGIAPWPSDDRITFLLLGLDMRKDEKDTPTRSDTIILLTIDPATKKAGMLSIPRDLWVPIPGHGENKITTAHFFGEIDQPGGGPALAKKTIEYNFGIKINYYARVDFTGFSRLIDSIDGVTIDVDKPIKDDEYPTEDSGTLRFYIPTGIQHMDGQTALHYARSRHSDNDFGRALRQQQVILAARQKILQPSIIAKVPQLMGILFDSVKTDVSITDVLSLFQVARSINPKDITSRAVDASLTIDAYGDGTVLIPDRRKIRLVMDELFSGNATKVAQTVVAGSKTTPTATVASQKATSTPIPTSTPVVLPTTVRPPSTPTVKPLATASRSLGTVRVYNGTMRERFASNVADRLTTLGYKVDDIGQAARSDYDGTVILDHTGKTNLAQDLASLLGVPGSAVRRDNTPSGGVDLTIVLGLDARLP